MNKSLVSLGECNEVVRKLLNSDRFQVVDYEIGKYCDGYPGFLGDYFSLRIRVIDMHGNPRDEKFFVKSLPVTNLEKRKVLEDFGVFKKECDVFAYLIPELLKYSSSLKWAPTCFLSRDDLLVFEDLKMGSYQTLPKQVDPNINHIKMALTSLAAFHASNIIYERLELRPKGSSIGDMHKDMLFESSYAIDNPWCMTGVRALKTVALHKTKYGIGSCYEQVIEENFFVKACEIFKRLDSIESPIPRVCCHRDLWKNNLMYQFTNDDFDKPSHCLLIDYQICRYLPLTVDVIICILLPSRDHSNADECLRFYFEALSSELKLRNINIKDLMSWNDFLASCENFKLLPLLQQGLFWSLTNLPDGVLSNLLANNEREYIKICNEDRSQIVLEFMEKDEYYRETMVETVERLIEYLFVDGGKIAEK